MARYTGPVCKLCRRDGMKLFLKGERCYSDKCSYDRRPYPPGQHGQRRSKATEYGVRLREKQKLRRIYGVLEAQMRRYFDLAERKQGVTGDNLLQLLERRLDNVVYRLGFAGSRAEARQLVRHGHFTVNGKKVNIPSYQVAVGEEIQLKDSSKKSTRIQQLVEELGVRSVPEWLELDVDNTKGRVVSLPTREQIETPIQEHLIIEYYSR